MHLINEAAENVSLARQTNALRKLWTRVWETAHHARRDECAAASNEAGSEALIQDVGSITHDIEVYDDMVTAVREHQEKMRALHRKLRFAPQLREEDDTSIQESLKHLKARRRLIMNAAAIESRIEASNRVLKFLGTHPR